MDRGALAALLWPESDQKNALTNLRSLLARSKHEPFAAGLEVETSRVRWTVSCDVEAFQEACHDQRWKDAVDLYTGPLLDKMAFHVSPSFDDWLDLMRESLQDAYRTAALRLAEDLSEAERIDEALAVTRELLRREPLDESAIQLTMRLLAAAGRPDAAVRTYQDFERDLATELQLEPSSATHMLLEGIERGEVRRPPAPGGRERAPRSAPLHRPTGGLPPALTPFFGRRDETRAVLGHLRSDACKLVTITGPGGVGKTRLATVAAERIEVDYGDGIAFVPLESVANSGDVAAAIATALDVKLRRRERPESQLVRGIGDRHVLLVLDNFEHVLGATDLVSHLLVACPRLDILVTSRERLGLPFERLIDLRGLPYPTEPSGPADAERFPAIALLLARTRQVRPDVPLDHDTIAAAVDICDLVQGLPLALELAAVGAKSMPLRAIASEIGRNLDFLSFGPAASTSRHRSVRAAFEHSWRLLSPRERGAMRKLSVFQGGFRRSAAAFVADASIAVLAALVDKSLLRVSLDGRYDCHPLIAAFALEKLHGDPEVEHDARRRHAEYLVWLLEQAQPHFGTERRQTWHDRLEPERENLSAAMEFAWDERDAALGAHLVLMLRWLYWPWGFMASRRRIVRALVDLDGDVRPDIKAQALHVKGVVAHTEGKIDDAVEAYERAIELANSPMLASIVIRCHSNLAYIDRDRGRRVEAREHFDRALELLGHAGETPSAANMLNNVATLDRQDGAYERARERHEHALRIGRALGDPLTLCQSLNGLAYLERDLGRERETASLLEESLSIGREHEIAAAVISCSEALARLARQGGDLATALRHLREGLTALRETRTFRLLDRSLDGAADLLAASGCLQDAVRMWHAAKADRASRDAAHPMDTPPDRADLQQNAREALDDDAYERAASAGLGLDREAAIDAALGALDRLAASAWPEDDPKQVP